ncbi:LPXTG-motif cell wall anchor domain protein [Corynebacterium efficiens YS-314]|nr:LPXTG-motif cell wall anchor domain protein [Corynebacterium efficiens YS-314]
MKKLLIILLTIVVAAFPQATHAQEQVGSLTVKKLPTTLDSPGMHPVAFELTGDTLAAPVVLRSDTDTVRFSDLAPGIYTVRELPTHVGDVARLSIAPTTVTIPRGGLYDVIIGPKPQPLTLLKTADVTSIQPGGDFTYTLDGTVPLPDINGQLHRYILRDALPYGVARTDTGLVSVSLESRGASVGLRAGEHYTVSHQDDPVVRAVFTDSGLDLLARERTANAGLVVRFTFSVKAADSLPVGSQILNIASLYPDGYPENGGDSVRSNEHSIWVVQPGAPSPTTIPAGKTTTPTSTATSTAGSATPTAGSATPTPTTGAVTAPADTTPRENTTRSSGLASTGASILGFITVGLLLSAIGLTIILRGRRE